MAATMRLDAEMRERLRQAISAKRREQFPRIDHLKGDEIGAPVSPRRRPGCASTNQPTTLGERLRQLRELHGITQGDMSLSTGLAAGYISRIEKGQRNPSGKALRVIAQRLGVTALELETGDAAAPCPHCGRVSDQESIRVGS